MTGVPMVPVVSRTGEGLDKLFDTVIDVFEGKDPLVRHVHVNLGADLEAAIRQLVDRIKATPSVSKHFSPRYMAIKLLEGDHEMEEEIETTESPDGRQERGKDSLWSRLTHRYRNSAAVTPGWREHVRRAGDNPIILLRDKLRGRIESMRDEEISSIVAAEKYGFVAGALAETYTPGRRGSGRTTQVLDSVATSRVWGFPLFIAIMLLIFWATFVLGQYPMDWLETAVAWLSSAVHSLMPAGPLKDLVADGIIGGVGGVIVFLPNILILYFCISFMEDTGYMARAAFIMDKVMHRIGLHGKSFIPLVMGFGCNV
ncbi:MAG: hypothetical protein K2F91_07960, partial [Muribaculaceae bacterium]|nr:hypothetical protein [Muribaculaceae bacterium]